jgi:hypothetical protein
MDMAGKTVLVTGSTDGVGRYVAVSMSSSATPESDPGRWGLSGASAPTATNCGLP